MDSTDVTRMPARKGIASAFKVVEDGVYIALGLLLSASALILIADGVYEFVHLFRSLTVFANTVILLDRILLILLVVELLYTVQVSFREHAVVPEPFLLVGLIAAIRRVLILTAEFSQERPVSDVMFQRFVIELGVLTLLVVALTVSLFVLRKRGVPSSADRA